MTNRRPTDVHTLRTKKDLKKESKQRPVSASPKGAKGSSDKGNGKADKPRPYLDPVQHPSVQRDVLDNWEMSFGRISSTMREVTARLITSMVRKQRYGDEDFIAVVDAYAATKPKPVISPLEFFDNFDEWAAWAGVEAVND